MHKFLMTVLLGILPAMASAGVYKWVDADGTVHFSDIPQEGAEKVHVPPAQTYQAPSLAPLTPAAAEPEAQQGPYARFALITPNAEENIWDNTGKVTVVFTSEPPLQTDLGHRLIVLLDGQAQAPLLGTSTTLENVDRGSHSLQGQIVDARGDVLMSSETISVHVHRQSVLAPQRAKPQPKP